MTNHRPPCEVYSDLQGMGEGWGKLTLVAMAASRPLSKDTVTTYSPLKLSTEPGSTRMDVAGQCTKPTSAASRCSVLGFFDHTVDKGSVAWRTQWENVDGGWGGHFTHGIFLNYSF